MKEPNFSFSPEAFKKWMEEYEKKETKKQKKNNLIRIAVESKLGSKRLANHVEPKDGELTELIEDFCQQGGTIYDVRGRDFLIEVNSGFFYVPRFFTKRIK
jgi:hypothetical protein